MIQAEVTSQNQTLAGPVADSGHAGLGGALFILHGTLKRPHSAIPKTWCYVTAVISGIPSAGWRPREHLLPWAAVNTLTYTAVPRQSYLRANGERIRWLLTALVPGPAELGVWRRAPLYVPWMPCRFF